MTAFKDGSFSFASLNQWSAALPKEHQLVISMRHKLTHWSELIHQQAIKLFPHIELIKTFTQAPGNVRMRLFKYEKTETRKFKDNQNIQSLRHQRKTTTQP